MLIHCDLGLSRLPTIIIAYLIRTPQMQHMEVISLLSSKQKIKPRPNFMCQLQVWEDMVYQIWENEDRTIPKAPYRAFLEDRASLLKKKGLTGNEPLAPQNIWLLTWVLFLIWVTLDHISCHEPGSPGLLCRGKASGLFLVPITHFIIGLRYQIVWAGDHH
jgi:hypothetical protein